MRILPITKTLLFKPIYQDQDRGDAFKYLTKGGLQDYSNYCKGPELHSMRVCRCVYICVYVYGMCEGVCIYLK